MHFPSMHAVPKVRTLLRWRDLLCRAACWQIFRLYRKARATLWKSLAGL